MVLSVLGFRVSGFRVYGFRSRGLGFWGLMAVSWENFGDIVLVIINYHQHLRRHAWPDIAFLTCPVSQGVARS